MFYIILKFEFENVPNQNIYSCDVLLKYTFFILIIANSTDAALGCQA